MRQVLLRKDMSVTKRGEVEAGQKEITKELHSLECKAA